MKRLTRTLLPGAQSGFLALCMAAAGIVAAAPYASAADLPAAPAYYPPSYHPPLYDWTGVYIGGNVGVGLLLDSVTQQTAAVTPAGTVTSLNPYGLVGGGQFGVNFQFAPWVVGFEATFDSSNISGSGTTPSTAGNAVGVGIANRATSEANWYATAAARFGYAADTLLFYGKAGAAWMRANYTQDLLIAPAGGVALTQTIPATRSGFVVGAGLEYGLTENFSLKFEYDFFDFGTRNTTFTEATVTSAGIPGFLPPTLAPVAAPVSIKSDSHLFTFGLNYRFNWSGGHSPY